MDFTVKETKRGVVLGFKYSKVCQHMYTVLILLETSWIRHFNRVSMGNFGYIKSFVLHGVLNIVCFSPGSRDASFLGTNDVVLGENPFCSKAPSRSKFFWNPIHLIFLAQIKLMSRYNRYRVY